MITNYTQALNWLYTQPTGKTNPDLTYVEKILQELGSPHLSVPVIHVTGTNGKGSTIAFLDAILQEHGLTVAKFTSPHLLSFNERFQINHNMISNEEIITYFNQLKTYKLTQFELFTCLFFLYMADNNPDVALVEVGIGGLFDTTNVVHPQLSVITSVGLDHLGLLGNTIEDITKQKAGIIKQNIPVFISQVPTDCLALFKDIAQAKNSPVYAYPYGKVISHYELLPHGISFKVDGFVYRTNIVGKHQLYNATLALACAQHYLQTQFNVQAAQNGLLKARWAGRMELVYDKPLIYLDGAHNEQGIQALIETLYEKFPNRSVKIIFGALARKDYSAMLNLLAEHFETYVTSFDYVQAAKLEELQHIQAKVLPLEDWQHSIQTDLREAKDELIIFTGSLYFIAEVKDYFNKLTQMS